MVSLEILWLCYYIKGVNRALSVCKHHKSSVFVKKNKDDKWVAIECKHDSSITVARIGINTRPKANRLRRNSISYNNAHTDSQWRLVYVTRYLWPELISIPGPKLTGSVAMASCNNVCINNCM